MLYFLKDRYGKHLVFARDGFIGFTRKLDDGQLAVVQHIPDKNDRFEPYGLLWRVIRHQKKTWYLDHADKYENALEPFVGVFLTEDYELTPISAGLCASVIRSSISTSGTVVSMVDWVASFIHHGWILLHKDTDVGVFHLVPASQRSDEVFGALHLKVITEVFPLIEKALSGKLAYSEYLSDDQISELAECGYVRPAMERSRMGQYDLVPELTDFFNAIDARRQDGINRLI